MISRQDLSPYRLVVHCGACMWNRREMLGRILRCQQAGVPITNYGLAIAYSLGIFERALEPFPAALELWRNAARSPATGMPAPAAASKGCEPRMKLPLTLKDILAWLREEDPERLETLWAGRTRPGALNVGDAVHLRGLVEISNRCVRQCAYCGLRAGNRSLTRYRMSAGGDPGAARQAVAFGYGTVVLQAGEDFGLSCEWVADIVRQIKAETPLAVTLSLGERTDAGTGSLAQSRRGPLPAAL